MSRVAVMILVLIVLLAAVAAVAVYLFNSLSPALAVAGIGAVLSLCAFAVASVALLRQQSVVSEQTALAVLVDKSLVRVNRRVEEQEVKFAAARALSAIPTRAEAAPEETMAVPQRNRRERVEPPRTALEVASETPQEARPHRARFMPPPTDLAVGDATPKPAAQPVFGEHFEAMLEPIVAIPNGTIAGYHVLAGFPQADGRMHAVSELPEGAWGERASTFGDRLFARTASIALRHFEGAGDVQLYVPIPAAMLADNSSIRALRQRLADNPALARSLVLVVGARTLGALKSGAVNELAAIRESGAGLAVRIEDEGADAAGLAAQIGARAILAPIALFPVASQPGWLDAVLSQGQARVVATGISAENSVIAMMDRNVGYMSGPLFAEPRRLRDDSESVQAA